MKEIILCGWGLLLVAACSNKYDSIKESAPKQELSFSKDTVRIRERDTTNVLWTDHGRLTIYCKDPDHQLNLLRDDTCTVVHVLYRGNEIKAGQSLPLMDSVQVFVFADTPGNYGLEFLLTDRLGRMIQKTVVVDCRTNQRPASRFIWWAESQTQPQSWPYVIDASTSSKPDGLITRYDFSINGQWMSSTQAVFKWIFHAKGEQVVGLSVADDLGQVSDTVYQKINVQ